MYSLKIKVHDREIEIGVFESLRDAEKKAYALLETGHKESRGRDHHFYPPQEILEFVYFGLPSKKGKVHSY